MKQNDRVLRALRLGPTSQAAWFNPTDGGPPITRLAARIFDLREQGYQICSHWEPDIKLDVYTLHAGPTSVGPSLPGQPPALESTPASPPLGLLSDPGQAPSSRNAIDDDWETAA